MKTIVDKSTGEILSLPPDVPISGEIVPYDSRSFTSLAEAEAGIYSLLDEGESLRLKQIKILLSIRDQQLYRERVDTKTGQPYVSFDSYMKGFLGSSASFSGDAPRTLRSWLSRYLVYVTGLALPESSLVDLGSHLEVMLPLAAKGRKCELLEDDEELPTGGMRLGRDPFDGFVKDIIQKVNDSRNHPDVPEMRWGIRQTKDAVAEILGTDDEKSNLEFSAARVGDNVKWTGLTAWVADQPYRIGDVIPVSVWAVLTKGQKVEGLE